MNNTNTMDNMETVRILIAEDDIVIAQDMRLSLKKIGYEVLPVVKSGEELLQFLQEDLPDLILLDINLAGVLDGIDTARQLKEAFDIPFIYLTSLADRATLERAKITEPQAYLVKPASILDLQRNIELAVYKSKKKNHLTTEISEKPLSDFNNPEDKGFLMNNHLFVKVRNRLEKVSADSILWIEAKDIYSSIKTLKNCYVVSHSLKELEHIFSSDNFLRVHRSFMVALDKIDAIEDNNLIIQDKYIPIGKTYKNLLLQRLRII